MHLGYHFEGLQIDNFKLTIAIANESLRDAAALMQGIFYLD